MEDIVAIPRVETRRVAVRSTDWLDGLRRIFIPQLIHKVSQVLCA